MCSDSGWLDRWMTGLIGCSWRCHSGNSGAFEERGSIAGSVGCRMQYLGPGCSFEEKPRASYRSHQEAPPFGWAPPEAPLHSWRSNSSATFCSRLLWGSGNCPASTLTSCGPIRRFHYPLSFGTGRGVESFVCFECMNVTTVCLLLTGLPWTCELTVFCVSLLQLSCYCCSQWWPRT